MTDIIFLFCSFKYISICKNAKNLITDKKNNFDYMSDEKAAKENEPKVSIKEVYITDIDPQKTDLSVKIAVKNPLPVDATIKKVTFSIYRLTEDMHEEYMGRGEENGVKIEKLRENLLDIPISVKNRSLVYAAANFLTGDLTVIIRGSLFFDLKLFSPEIKFEEKKVLKGLPKRLFED